MKDGISISELKNITEILKVNIREIIRKRDKLYKQLNIENIYDEDEIYEILSKNIKIIERPIVINGDAGVIGRPPENIKKII